MRKLRIGYFADGPWSHKAFNRLIKNDNIEIKFICVRFNSNDNTLREYSKNYNIKYFKCQNVNSDSFINQILPLKCNLFVSMSYNQIFKKKILSLPEFKTINCHAGKLPFYRGRNILNWALINDEKEFGITVHYVDVGIDTGDIILQRSYPITDDDSYSTLLNKSYIECARILCDSISLIISNNINIIKQQSIDEVGSYMRKRVEGDEILSWNQSSRQIFNFVRALSHPGPIARTFLNNIEMKINKLKISTIKTEYVPIPGFILDINSGIYVQTNDGVVIIQEYNYIGKIDKGSNFH